MQLPPPAPPDLEPVRTDSGMVCPADRHLLILWTPEEVKCPDCERIFYAAGHLDFDFDWLCPEPRP